MKDNKLVNIAALAIIYCSYLVWDYFHHKMLVQTISKNMAWLAFRYSGGSFQYSWDLILLTPVFLGILFLIVKKGFGFKSVITFALIAIISGLLL